MLNYKHIFNRQIPEGLDMTTIQTTDSKTGGIWEPSHESQRLRMDAENTIIVQCEHGIQVSQKNDNSHTREVNLRVITNCAVSSRATSLNVRRVEDMQS